MPVEYIKANSRINQREEKSEEKLSRGNRVRSRPPHIKTYLTPVK